MPEDTTTQPAAAAEAKPAEKPAEATEAEGELLRIVDPELVQYFKQNPTPEQQKVLVEYARLGLQAVQERETLRKLGIDPDKVFEKAVAGTKAGTASELSAGNQEPEEPIQAVKRQVDHLVKKFGELEAGLTAKEQKQQQEEQRKAFLGKINSALDSVEVEDPDDRTDLRQAFLGYVADYAAEHGRMPNDIRKSAEQFFRQRLEREDKRAKARNQQFLDKKLAARKATLGEAGAGGVPAEEPWKPDPNSPLSWAQQVAAQLEKEFS